MKQFLVCLVITVSLPVIAQNSDKKVINNDTYELWNSISNILWSENGTIFTYQVSSPKSDGWLYFQNANSLEKDSIYKGEKPEIHYQSKYAVFSISPGYDTIRQLKLKGTKPDKLPKDSLGIKWFNVDSMIKIPNVKSFAIAENGDWMAYLSESDDRPECPKYKKWQWIKKRKKCDRPKTTGHTLTVYNPISSKKNTIERVVNYRFNKSGSLLYYSTSIKGEADSISLYVLDLQNNNTDEIIKNQLDISSFALDETGKQVAFTTTTDTNKLKTYQLAYWSIGDSIARILVDTTTPNLKEGWAVSEYSRTNFSKDNKRIFFGTNQKVEQTPEDSLLDNEKAKLDVWSWTDKQIQPQQLSQLRRMQKQNFPTSYNLSTNKLTHLTTEENESVYVNYDLDRGLALGRNTDKYLLSNSWEFPWKADYFTVDFHTGIKIPLLTEQAFFPSLSPSGQYLVWYNGADSSWMATVVTSRKIVNLTKNIEANFYRDNNGNPSDPFPEGVIGWTNTNGHEQVLIQSEFDIYQLDPENHTNIGSVTKNIGVATNTKYTLYNFDEDSVYVDLNRCLFKGVHQKTKAEFLFKRLDFSTPIFGGDFSFLDIQKPANSDHILYRTMTVNEYPDLYLTSFDFEKSTQITNVNPQQSDYNWATVEQVYWRSYKGLELEGLLYKPENFDSTKQYPMIVYFYEKNDDRYHNYYSPRPTASIVFPTEYASNGYIVFIPNIHYTPGHPAQSAYDCIVSGTDYLTNKYGWIDTTKLALQGQSWGGYQTAQLITMTDKYACAMAGAPVSNMFSAYGGIRWGSGMSRMFQYEKTQSRIGCTIWECPELYMENSPIFGLPKVKTPLLIMHNDNDGAVPWYQGIEMFMGLRRLEKPVWMLNYNGDEHNLMQNANREDLSLRMRQFFDYYLKDEPMPLWMKNGVPALEKGDPSNLELESED